ncbi:MAG: hypothetical protein IPM94_12890, partial [bacterium]|nr:hypothetical protein [bacterium]
RDDGATEWLAEATVGAAELPRAARFADVHPNPFNPRVTAAFDVGAPQRVRIAVADARGREVVLPPTGKRKPAGTRSSGRGATETALAAAGGRLS